MVLTPSNFQNSEIPHVMFHLFKSVSTIKGDSTMKKDKDIFSYISSEKLNYEVWHTIVRIFNLPPISRHLFSVFFFMIFTYNKATLDHIESRNSVCMLPLRPYISLSHIEYLSWLYA